MNYLNRVKGSRPVGSKIFMQGGVCYNKAVPIAMAALSGKKIIVPPEPGLMGAYGVALEVKYRLDKGLMNEKIFDLESLANREVTYKKPFVCSGGREKCDFKCSINRLFIDGKTYPFGGACNMYYNIHHKVKINSDKYNFVDLRQKLVYKEYAHNISNLKNNVPTVGILRSFLTNTYYPMFAHFFKELGFQPVLPEKIEQAGIDRCTAPLCFPCEISYGYFKNLIDLKPDYIFLPHICGLKVENGYHPSKLCPLLQGEAYFLQSSFEKELLKGPKVISNFIDFDTDIETQRKFFTSIAQQLEVNKNKARAAYDKARVIQDEMQKQMVELGNDVIDKIERDPDKICIVLFGRPYNAFVPEANKGIPHKFASRGITVIPDDFLNLKNFPTKEHMFWSAGQIILKAAECVKNHPQLFGVYITNFSCGPDSFLLGYFREIMGKKPSLTLELDSHTADTGIETRVEAFLDIVKRYRHLQKNKALEEKRKPKIYHPANLILNKGKFSLIDSEGRGISIYDPRIKFIFPSMGQYSSQAIAAVMKSQGIDAIALPSANEEILKLGRANTTCKECLPLQLTFGSLLKYLRESQRENEVTIYFMPTTEGPCRFGQYKDFMMNFIKKNKIENVAFMSLSSDNAYGGIGTELLILIWCAAIISDIFEDILNAIIVAAENKDKALIKLQDIWNSILCSFEKGIKDLKKAIQQAAIELKHIPHKSKIDKFPQILIVGEIYVRKEDLPRRWLPKQLAKHGIISHVAPIHEWVYYTNWLLQHGLSDTAKGLKERTVNKIKDSIMKLIEVKIKNTIAESGWYTPRIVNINETIKAAENYISRKLTGEAILTVGGPITKVGREFCGAIAIGPFACMPSRLSEALLYQKMDRYHITKIRSDGVSDSVTREIPTLPLLVIESDGNSFPQIIEAQLENFIVQALRVNKVMAKYKN
jgi:predicted nucleotide-binding protein (sugar kinase/HSP70/actin superfamily)